MKKIMYESGGNKLFYVAGKIKDIHEFVQEILSLEDASNKIFLKKYIISDTLEHGWAEKSNFPEYYCYVKDGMFCYAILGDDELNEYSFETMFDCLEHMSTLHTLSDTMLIQIPLTDTIVEYFWHLLGDVPMNLETEWLEVPFLHFGHTICRENVWRWFDRNHSEGIQRLLSSV